MMGALPSAIGPYRIVRLLGEGGMGAVYEARQEPLDRRVALKTLHPEYARNQEAVARFFNEAKVLSKLEHPSIVQVSDFGHTPDGIAYLVMEYLRGESLAHRLAGLAELRERLPLIAALQFTWQVADILAVAHAQGIVHRDLKPDNLMLVADPVAPGGERVKILDFGIAKLTKSGDRIGVKTDTQAVMGTPMYMSPEQCAGAGGVDAKTDVYSLGCVLYEALAGRPPFVAEGAGQLIGMHLFQTPPPLSSFAPKVPTTIAELVHRLLTRDKAQRPSMSETCDELGRILSKLSGGGNAVRSRPPASTDPDATRALLVARPSTTLGQSIGQWGFSSPRRRSLLVASVAGLVLASLLAVLLRSGRHPIHTAIPTQPADTQTLAASPRDSVTLSLPISPMPLEKPIPVAQPQRSQGKLPSPPPIQRSKQGPSNTPRPESRTTPVNRTKVPKAKDFDYEK